MCLPSTMGTWVQSAPVQTEAGSTDMGKSTCRFYRWMINPVSTRAVFRWVYIEKCCKMQKSVCFRFSCVISLWYLSTARTFGALFRREISGDPRMHLVKAEETGMPTPGMPATPWCQLPEMWANLCLLPAPWHRSAWGCVRPARH